MIHRFFLLFVFMFATVTYVNAQCATKTGLTNLSITNSQQFATALAGDTYYWSFDGVKGNIYVFSTCNGNNDNVHTRLQITDYEYKVHASDSGNVYGCSETKAYIEWECPADDIYYLDITEVGCAPLSASIKLAYQVKEISPVMYSFNQFAPHVGEANYLVNLIEIDTEKLTTGDFLLQNLKFDFSKVSNKSNISEIALYVATVNEDFEFKSFTLLKNNINPETDILDSLKTNLQAGINYLVLFATIGEKAEVGEHFEIPIVSAMIDSVEYKSVLYESSQKHLCIPAFEEEISIENEDAYFSVDLGDYDNDNDFDVLFPNSIYKNVNGSITGHKIDLPAVSSDYSKWIDLNKDGNLDFFALEEGFLNLYINNQGEFTLNEKYSVPAVKESGDIIFTSLNNDGKQDIVMLGEDLKGMPQLLMYMYSDSGFVKNKQVFEPLMSASLCVIDIENDSDKDIFYCGKDINNVYHSILLVNTPTGFVKVKEHGVAALAFADCIAADLNNDGYSDLVIAGYNSKFEDVIEVYLNNKKGAFTKMILSDFSIVEYPTLQIFDFNADGFKDILVSGKDIESGLASLKLYENKAGKSFPMVEYLGIEPLYFTEIEIFDFDKNGSIDLFINGLNDDDSVVTKVFLNKITSKNKKPSVPTGLKSERGSNYLKLMWNHATDTESSKESLVYNIKIGSTPGANDVLNSYVSEKENLLLFTHFSTTDTMFILNNIAPGKYYWSVQAVDPGLNRSAFSEQAIIGMIGFSQICVVTTNEKNQNIVVWQREPGIGIKQFNIYRGTAELNKFEKIGEVDYSDTSRFVDTYSNISEEAFRYRISSVDSFGYESDYSSYHKTIHLMTSYSTGSNPFVNLWWNKYEGVDFQSYIVYRGVDSMVAYKPLSADAVSWTDINPIKNGKYRIGVKLLDSCNATALKSDSGPFSQSLSNISESQLSIDVDESSSKRFNIFPVPSSSNVFIDTDDEILRTKVFDKSGVLIDEKDESNVSKNIPVQGMKPGVYILQVSTQEAVYSSQFIVQ